MWGEEACRTQGVGREMKRLTKHKDPKDRMPRKRNLCRPGGMREDKDVLEGALGH